MKYKQLYGPPVQSIPMQVIFKFPPSIDYVNMSVNFSRLSPCMALPKMSKSIPLNQITQPKLFRARLASQCPRYMLVPFPRLKPVKAIIARAIIHKLWVFGVKVIFVKDPFDPFFIVSERLKQVFNFTFIVL